MSKNLVWIYKFGQTISLFYQIIFQNVGIWTNKFCKKLESLFKQNVVF